MNFRKYCPRCVVIIDCFDREAKKPSCAHKHSLYINITPQGTVCFISEGWEGRVSDKYLTEQSRIVKSIYTIIAWRYISSRQRICIRESVGSYCANLQVPAFTRGKQQLSGIVVEQSRRIANIHIHVERIIGNIRQKFSLLSATQLIGMMNIDGLSGETVTTLDRIVHVACALINMCASVVISMSFVHVHCSYVTEHCVCSSVQNSSLS